MSLPNTSDSVAHEVFSFDRALMRGDKLYGRENAAAYRDKFERPYGPLLRAGVRFYASLGNHDDAAQRNYAQFNMDGRQSGIVHIIQGGAAKLRRGNIRTNSEITANGFDTDRSFTLAEIVADQMYLETISRTGTIVDTTVITRRDALRSSSE